MSVDGARRFEYGNNHGCGARLRCSPRAVSDVQMPPTSERSSDARTHPPITRICHHSTPTESRPHAGPPRMHHAATATTAWCTQHTHTQRERERERESERERARPRISPSSSLQPGQATHPKKRTERLAPATLVAVLLHSHRRLFTPTVWWCTWVELPWCRLTCSPLQAFPGRAGDRKPSSWWSPHDESRAARWCWHAIPGTRVRGLIFGGGVIYHCMVWCHSTQTWPQIYISTKFATRDQLLEHDSTQTGRSTSPTPEVTYADPHPVTPPPTLSWTEYMSLDMQYGAQGASVIGGESGYAALAPRKAEAGDPTYVEPEPCFGFDEPTT
jgi:hypothetical protein